MVNVSIIIVNYNTYDLVVKCILSVLNNTYGISYEIIVVDNNSPDRRIENLQKEFPEVVLVLNPTNDGFGSANNIGNKYAKGYYLFLLNSDTILKDNSIYELYCFLEENMETVGACGGNLCDENLKPATSFSRFMPSFLSDIDQFFFNMLSKTIYRKNCYYAFSKEPFEVKGNISGADLMIQKKIFDKLNGFDENYFMYYEETDLLFRLRNINYKTYIVPRSEIIHLEGASEVLQVNKLNRTYDSKKKYYLKNKSKFALLLSNGLMFITIIQRLIVFKMLCKKEKYKYWLGIYKWFRDTVF